MKISWNKKQPMHIPQITPSPKKASSTSFCLYKLLKSSVLKKSNISTKTKLKAYLENKAFNDTKGFFKIKGFKGIEYQSSPTVTGVGIASAIPTRRSKQDFNTNNTKAVFESEALKSLILNNKIKDFKLLKNRKHSFKSKILMTKSVKLQSKSFKEIVWNPNQKFVSNAKIQFTETKNQKLKYKINYLHAFWRLNIGDLDFSSNTQLFLKKLDINNMYALHNFILKKPTPSFFTKEQQKEITKIYFKFGFNCPF